MPIFKKRTASAVPSPESLSPAMGDAVRLWLDMYMNVPPWLGAEGCARSLNLPAGIASAAARLILTEFDFSLDGSYRAQFIQNCLKNTLDDLAGTVGTWCALGGAALRPYVYSSDPGASSPDMIGVDVVRADRFRPTASDPNGNITGAVFTDTRTKGEHVYTRLEEQSLSGDRYTVINRAFRSDRRYGAAADLSRACEISLEQVEAWRGIRPEVTISGVRRPLFAYVKTPLTNTVDPDSPLGVSIYHSAAGLIEEADRQFSRTLWEYEAKEAAIDADENIFTLDRKGNPVLPRGKERLFRTYDFASTGFLQAYSPGIRDTALWGGLNRILRSIEFSCGLAYGTISDLSGESSPERTATEIKFSKQRSFASVRAMQRAWDAGFDSLLYAMETLCDLYDIAPGGNVIKTVTWGDGVLEDLDAEYARRMRMAEKGIITAEEFREWYFS